MARHLVQLQVPVVQGHSQHCTVGRDSNLVHARVVPQHQRWRVHVPAECDDVIDLAHSDVINVAHSDVIDVAHSCQHTLAEDTGGCFGPFQ